MSFFDEDEEETRVRPPGSEAGASSPGTGSTSPTGGSRSPRRGRRPPGGGGGYSRGGRRVEQERVIRVRQAVAVAALLVILVLIVIGVHSCTVSQTNSALRSYNDSVNSLIHDSNQTGHRFFTLLASGTGSTSPTNLQTQVNATRMEAENQVRRAQGLNPPGQVAQAHRDLALAVQMRRDAITNIANLLPDALQGSTSAQAVNQIAAEMARLYASDVLYKDYSLPMIKRALENAGIAVGGVNGLPVNNGQFVPNIQWLTPAYVSQQLHGTGPASTTTKPAPGIHGHMLNSCSIGGTTLDTSLATSVPAGSPPTLSCTVANDGQNTETNVVVKASVGGTSITGQGTIPQTQPGQQYTVQIPLSSTPPAGTYSLTVTVQRVPGETTVTHNTKVFPVTLG